MNEIDWDEIQRHRFSSSNTPPHWDKSVKPISGDGLVLFGIDPATNDLYWNGQKVQTTRRFSNVERAIAFAGLAAAWAIAVVEIGRSAQLWP